MRLAWDEEKGRFDYTSPSPVEAIALALCEHQNEYRIVPCGERCRDGCRAELNALRLAPATAVLAALERAGFKVVPTGE